MGKTSIAALVVLAAFPAAPAQELRLGQERNKVEGTWEHVVPDGSPEVPRTRQLKVINQDHFMWITYDRESKLSQTSAGGSYTLEGNTYQERVEFGRFGTPELQTLVGQEMTYEIEIYGDLMIMTGDLPFGQRLREVWRRVK